MWRHSDQKLPGSTSVRRRQASRNCSTHPTSASPSSSPSSIPGARIRRCHHSARLPWGNSSGPTGLPAATTCSRHVCTQGSAFLVRARSHRQHVLLLHPMVSANSW